jgi:hypothetical protein
MENVRHSDIYEAWEYGHSNKYPIITAMGTDTIWNIQVSGYVAVNCQKYVSPEIFQFLFYTGNTPPLNEDKK